MGIPLPPNGNVGQGEADLAAAQAKFYGEDIWFDLASATAETAADYVIDASGDVTIAEGLDALRQSLLRRLITSPGEWQTLPDFGVGAPQYVKRLNTAANRAELEGRIRAQFSQDDRVDSVAAVEISNLDETGQVQILVSVVASGRLRQDAPLPVSVVI